MVSFGPDNNLRAESSPKKLIADIAKFATCVLAISENDSGPTEVTAYPISRKDSSVMKDHPIFHLRNSEESAYTLNAYCDVSTEDDIKVAWLSLAQDRMLELADQTVANCQNDRLVVSVTVELLSRWREFAAKHFERDIIWTVGSGRLLRLCRVQLVGADDAATAQLDYLCCLLQLKQHRDRSSILQSDDRLLSWFRNGLNIEETTIRQIANVAFQLGEQQLSYEIAELEDMVDAAV